VYDSGFVVSAICIVNPLERNLLENAIGIERRKSQLLTPDRMESGIDPVVSVKGDAGLA
jgi:hypothetical protein